MILVAAAITLLGYGTLVTSTYPPLRSIGLVSVVSVVALAAASSSSCRRLLARSAASRRRRGNVAARRRHDTGSSNGRGGQATRAAAPRRWTLHGLNNGLIFSATYHGVRLLPRGAVVRDRRRRDLDRCAG